ncbi:neuroligin-1-like [Diachasmimorpha longicaudata]|uniref:neuroligin-1-like n=1 Tax=Diachasmimorpha longicaudata TaxID=58733 RepID=UPI0030B86E74
MRTRPSWTSPIGRCEKISSRSAIADKIKLIIIIMSIINYGDADGSQQHQSHQSIHTQQQQQLKYSTRQVKTRYGTLRGIVARSAIGEGVEVYLGVPYATPPLGALRFMPPVTPTQWRGTRLADNMPSPCPQKVPGVSDPTISRHRRDYIERITPLLVNQSEDCLYLNLYVPRTHSSSTELLPAVLLIHGDSYTWGTGNSLDGTALAAHGRIIVVSINFRLGVLGFLKTSTKGSAQGNYGLMDLVAGLHWLRENVGAFGGDPERLSVLGHGTGAALANFLAVSPMAKELVERVVLLGGSALSPWAIQRDPLGIKKRVAEQSRCDGNVEADDIASCLRTRSVKELLAVKLDTPRFTSGFAPFADGAVLPLAAMQTAQPTASSAGVLPLVPGPGGEFATLGDRDLLIGLTTNEAWLDLSEDDMKNGLNESRRDRILRTFVRNTYRYHLNEIYSTLRNEYTDWERSEQSPAAIRDGLLSLLGDGQVAAPLLKLASLHSTSGGRGFFLHFQPGDRPSQRGEELPYLLGIPLLRNEPNRYNDLENFTLEDENLSRMLVRYLSNFVRRGDPNEGHADALTKITPFWDSYDSINQLYLEASKSPEMRSHYRGHKMALWLNLLPQLHRPGYEISMRHHHLADNPRMYEGAVRQQTMALPLPPPPLTAPMPTEASMSSPKSMSPVTTECTSNTSSLPLTTSSTYPTIYPTQQAHPKLSPGPNNLLRKFASNHYQSYTTALTVTIAVGIFLLLLNILIFAGIYHQRDRNAAAAAAAAAAAVAAATTSSSNSSSSMKSYLEHKKKEQLLEAGCSGDHSGSGKLSRLSSFIMTDSITSSPPHKHKLAEELELQLQEFQCSPPPCGKRMSLDPPSYVTRSPAKRSRTPSPCVDVAAKDNELEAHDPGIPPVDDDYDDEYLPEPPPPPKVPAPIVCPGILRQPGTPGSAKKRVQIQEISV